MKKYSDKIFSTKDKFLFVKTSKKLTKLKNFRLFRKPKYNDAHIMIVFNNFMIRKFSNKSVLRI